MSNFYQHLPSYIDPIIFSIGSFSVRWYSVMYLVGLFVLWKLLVWRIQHGEGGIKQDDLWRIVSLSFLGAIIGGRIGFFLFYDTGFLHENLLYIFWPFNPVTGAWSGLSGMSFFGAFIGAIFMGWGMARRLHIDFVRLADFVIPAVPLGYLFGRVGNFLNGELFGVQTSSAFGMYVDGILRHPSQLYEAFFEGAVLFAALWPPRNYMRFRGQMLSLYCVGYAVFRLCTEQFRSDGPEAWCAGISCSMGEFLSIGLFLTGIGLYFWFWSRKGDKIK